MNKDFEQNNLNHTEIEELKTKFNNHDNDTTRKIEKDIEEKVLEQRVVTGQLQTEEPSGKDPVDNLVYAGFWMRFWAYLVDIILIAAITGMIITPLFRYFDWPMNEISLFSPYTLATAAVFYLYFILMTKFFQQTLGKMIFGLKVIPLKEKSLTWGTVIFREWIGRYISVTVKILYFLVIFLPKKQGLHDIFADTAVIHENVVKKQPATI
ncbi:RDD family protein [Bacillus kwashiorkori]|uniref:RDD family protein n=1 Tax=Bacillus kwashiorkori TaxID=1522318 RepID=UPI000980C2A3